MNLATEAWPLTRRTKTITFSLLPEMAEQVQDVMREEGRTMSELIREALRRTTWTKGSGSRRSGTRD